MKSSVTMQGYTQMPPAGLQLHTPKQTSCSSVLSAIAQMEYYTAKQRMANPTKNMSWNSQSSSEPVSNSSHFQSRQMPQSWFTNLQNQLLFRNSASIRATLPKGQFAPLAAAQHGTPTQNLTLNRNTVSQQNNNTPLLDSVSREAVSWIPSVNSNAGSSTEQNNLTHRSVLPQYQSLNGLHNRMQITHQPTAQPHQTNQAEQKIHNNQGWIRGEIRHGALFSSAHNVPGTSQRLVTPSHPSNYSHQTGQSHSSCNGNQVQYSSQIEHQPSPYGAENNSTCYSHLKYSRNKHQSSPSNLPYPPSYTTKHFIIHSQPNHRINQSSALRLPQGNVQPHTPLQQCSTIPVSGHYSRTCHHTVPATQPQDVQLNNSITGLPRSFHITIPSRTPINEAPPPICTESALNNYSPVTCHLVGNNTQVPAERHDTSPLSCPKDSFTTQGQTPSHITTKANYSQIPQSAPYSGAPAAIDSKELHRVIKYQTPVQETPVLKENKCVLGSQLKEPDVQSSKGVQSRRLQTDLNTERMDGHQSNNRHGEVQYSKDVANSLELIMALQKVFQQSHKAVAVVPPISQQVPSPEKNAQVTTSSDDCLPFKISAVCTLVKESKDMDQESNASNLPKETIDQSSVPHPEEQEINKHEDGSTVNSLIPDTQRADSHQSKTDSTTSQGPVCATALTSKCPEDHTKVETAKFTDNIFDLSKVQVDNFTLQQFIYWVKLLESSTTVKEQVLDFEKCLLDLFWDGTIENIEKQSLSIYAQLSELFSGLSIENMQTAVFQYLKTTDLEMLAHGGHILKNDANLSTEEFKSSWLNIDGQPADIENILAEPILDLNLPDNYLSRAYTEDILKIYSMSDPSTKVIPETTNYQSDKMTNKELVNSQVCESKSNDKVCNTQEPSKKQEDENLEKHQQQDVNLNPEESVSDSNEMTNKLTESKGKTECEQVCRDASEDITSSLEIVEQRDLSNDLDSSNDSQLIKLSLLSADDARMIFKEHTGCDLQKEPSQLSQDETKVSNSDFCNSFKQIKFTCPHVTDTEWDGEHFCPMCLEETPLLDLDLDETLFSPNVGSPDISPLKQGHSCSPQSGNPDSNCTQLSESSSIADSPSPDVDVFEVTFSEPDNNPSDTVESGTSLSGNSPVTEPYLPMCTESVNITMPAEGQICETVTSADKETHGQISSESVKVTMSTEKEVCKADSLPGAEITKARSLSHKTKKRKLVTQSQTNSSREKVSPPRYPPCKKVKVTKITTIPASDALFTPDIAAKKPSSPKSGNPDSNCTPFSESSSIADSPAPNVNVFEVTMPESDPNLSDTVESSTSRSGNSRVKEPCMPICTESVNSTMPTEDQTSETDISMGPELPKALSHAQNLVILKQTKIPRDEVFPPKSPPCKNFKLTQTTKILVDDDRFPTEKKASSTKPHPSDLSVPPPEDSQNCKDERKKLGKERKASIKEQAQSNTKGSQAGKPDPNVNVCSESSSDSSNPSTYGVHMSITEPVPNLGDSVQSCSSLSVKSADRKTHGRVSSESVKVTLPIGKQVCGADSFSGAELPKARSLTHKTEKRKLVTQSQAKTSREKVSQPKYPSCKRIKDTKTTSIPANDDLFTPDIVGGEKASSPKPHPSALSVIPPKGDQDFKEECRERGKDRKSRIMMKMQLVQQSGQTKTEAHWKWKKPSVKPQVPSVTPQPKKPAPVANSDTNKEKVLGKTKGSGQSEAMKKMKFTLYGFNDGTQDRTVHHKFYKRTNSSAVPVHITISRTPEAATSYSVASTAKQKVYSQWSSTFVETKKKTSSPKKHQKHEQAELKSKTQALRRHLENRIAIKKKQMVCSKKHKLSLHKKCTNADKNMHWTFMSYVRK